MYLPSKEEASLILRKFVSNDYQLLHANMVAMAMLEYSRDSTDTFENYSKEQIEDLYYVTGLLHDLDYDQFPDTHPAKELEWFQDWSYPKELIHAVEAHAHGYNGFTTLPQTHLAAALMACDELSGFLYAYSLMRPNGFTGMEVKGVLKRLKDKSFAAKINRNDIYTGVELLDVKLEDHILKLILIYQKINLQLNKL